MFQSSVTQNLFGQYFRDFRGSGKHLQTISDVAIFKFV